MHRLTESQFSGTMFSDYNLLDYLIVFSLMVYVLIFSSGQWIVCE